MNKVQLIAATFAAAMLALPGANAAGSWDGQITARALRLDGGADNAVGGQAALHALFRFDLPEALDPSETGFHLRARSLHIETVEADPVLVGPEAVGGVPVAPRTVPADFSDSTVSGLTARTNYLLEVLALPGQEPPRLVSASSCNTVEASDRDLAQSQPKVDTARRPEVPVADALLLRECGSQGRFTVQGAFLLTLWEIDAELQSDGQAVQLKSGYDASESPGAAAAYPTLAKSRQQYLYVEDGQLWLDMDDSPHVAFVQDAQLDVAGRITFNEAVGALSRGAARLDVSSATLSLDGSLRVDGLASQGRDQSLSAHVAGQIASGQANGQPLDMAVVAQDEGASAWWLLGLVGLLAALAWSARLASVQVVASSRLRRAAGLARSEAPEIERLCSLVLARRDSGLARFLRARARTQTDDLAGARDDLRAAWDLLPKSSGQREAVALQAFLVSAQVGPEAERDEWLARWRSVR